MRNDICYTSLAIAGVVHTTTDTGGSRPSVDSTFLISSCEPRQAPTSIMSKSDAKPSSIENIRQGISIEGLSSQTIALLESSRRLGKQNHRNACWLKFSGWYQSKEINLVSATLNYVLKVLTSLYFSSLEYNTINCYRLLIFLITINLGVQLQGKIRKHISLLWRYLIRDHHNQSIFLHGISQYWLFS